LQFLRQQFTSDVFKLFTQQMRASLGGGRHTAEWCSLEWDTNNLTRNQVFNNTKLHLKVKVNQ